MGQEVAKKVSRETILAFEKTLASCPRAKFGNCYPLKHTFAEGVYVREIRVPAGEIIVTREFKQSHATFLLYGEVSIITDKGLERVMAPYSWITDSGVKRVIFTHTEVIWTTVHSNPDEERDIETLESRIADEQYKSFELSAEEQEFLETVVDV